MGAGYRQRCKSLCHNPSGTSEQTLILLKDEPRLSIDFQFLLAPSGEIWHYDLDRLLETEEEHGAEARVDRSRVSRQLQRFAKTVVKKVIKAKVVATDANATTLPAASVQ